LDSVRRDAEFTGVFVSVPTDSFVPIFDGQFLAQIHILESGRKKSKKVRASKTGYMGVSRLFPYPNTVM